MVPRAFFAGISGNEVNGGAAAVLPQCGPRHQSEGALLQVGAAKQAGMPPSVRVYGYSLAPAPGLVSFQDLGFPRYSERALPLTDHSRSRWHQ